MEKLVITGRPGVGKSTLFNAVISTLRENGFKVGGMIAPEVRDKGVRIGFKVVDLLTGEETWLAQKGYPSAARVGQYGVIIGEADALVKKALLRAIEQADVIGVDEVGPMELKLPSFKPLLLKVLNTGKPTILVVHFNLNDKEILSRLEGWRKIVLTFENREYYKKLLPREVLESIKSAL